jgi:hypothetical protein
MPGAKHWCDGAARNFSTVAVTAARPARPAQGKQPAPGRGELGDPEYNVGRRGPFAHFSAPLVQEEMTLMLLEERRTLERMIAYLDRFTPPESAA